jgi:hypothetical protein
MAAGQRRAAVNGRKHGASLLRIRLPQKRRRELALPASDGEKGSTRLVRPSVSVWQNKKVGSFCRIFPL